MTQQLICIVIGFAGMFVFGYAVGLNQNLFHKSLAGADRIRKNAENTTRICNEIKESFGQRPGRDDE